MLTNHAPATSEAAQLRAAFLRLDLRLRLAVDAFRGVLADRARDPFRGLYISETDVDELLSDTPPAELAHQLLASELGDAAPRLSRLASLFALDTFEQEALLVCLAPDVDLRYERLFGYLQDDVTRRRPTSDLVLRLLEPAALVAARAALGPGGTLQREGLLAPPDDSSAQLPLLARPLRLDERLVEYLLGSDRPDPHIANFSELHSEHGPAFSSPGVPSSLVDLLLGEGTRGPLVYLHGPAGSGKRTVARAACRAANRQLLLVDVVGLAATAKPSIAVGQIAREAALQNAVLGLDGIDGLLEENIDAVAIRGALRRVLGKRLGPTLVLGEARWEPASWLPEVPTIRVELSPPGLSERLDLWRSHLRSDVPTNDVEQLAERYHFDDEGVRAVLAAARGHSVWRGAASPNSDDLRAAARAIAAPPLEGLAKRIDPRYGWDDVVLTPDGLAQLQEMCGRARHQNLVLEDWGYGRKHARRAGLTGLFAGPPGTGKTMSAEIIAGELGLELYRIDLSAVVSKYIGETEKNLEKIFRAADQGDAVLLFDEADALFGKRSEVRDAHDRYANVEVAYLLQRLEVYEGVAILTTNLRGNVDEAFLRRLDCVLEFPLPEEPERLAIWRRSLPAEAPLDKDVDLVFLARKFKLAGGHIRNIALTAAFLAATDAGRIGMKHLLRGTRREYQKLGKLVAQSDFEQYWDLLKEG